MFRARNLEGESRRLTAEGEGEENISSFSRGNDLGLDWLGLSFARVDEVPDRPPDGTRRNGDLLTYSFLARPFNPMLCLGTRLPDRISGLSFSLLAETTLSPEGLLSPLPGAVLVRSVDVRLEPEGDGRPPLAERDVARGLADAVIPRPILTFGVEATPAAGAALSPIPLLPARS